MTDVLPPLVLNFLCMYHSSFLVGSLLWLVMPLLSGGSTLRVLSTYDRKQREQECVVGVSSGDQGVSSDLGFDEPCAAFIILEVLKAIDYFHRNDQIHRDIKASNILLGLEKYVLRLRDVCVILSIFLMLPLIVYYYQR